MIQMNIFVDWQSVKDEGRPPPGKEGKIVRGLTAVSNRQSLRES